MWTSLVFDERIAHFACLVERWRIAHEETEAEPEMQNGAPRIWTVGSPELHAQDYK
jgi:hypothetical protein